MQAPDVKPHETGRVEWRVEWRVQASILCEAQNDETELKFRGSFRAVRRDGTMTMPPGQYAATFFSTDSAAVFGVAILCYWWCFRDFVGAQMCFCIWLDSI
jgi:hypothetical protein